MEVLKKVCNVFGIIFAVIFSIVLMLVLLATPIVSSVSSFFQAETLHTVMKTIDYEEVLLSNTDVAATLEEHGLDAETVEAIVESKAVEETVALYMEDVFSAMEGELENKNLTAEAIKEIAYEHMDEIVEIAKDYKDPSESITDQKIEEQITAVIEEHAESVVELLPPPESLVEMGVVSTTATVVVQTVKNVVTGSIVWVLVFIAFFLSGLIVLCRIKRLQGFMWLGVVFLLAATCTFAISGVLGGIGVLEMLSLEGWIGTLVGSAVSIFSQKLIIGGVLLLVFGLLFTATFIVGRVLISKKKQKNPQSPI